MSNTSKLPDAVLGSRNQTDNSVGGKGPANAHRSYVKEGLSVQEDSSKDELREWVFGSEDFLGRIVALAEGATRLAIGAPL